MEVNKGLCASFKMLSLGGSLYKSSHLRTTFCRQHVAVNGHLAGFRRPFSSSTPRAGNWLLPSFGEKSKSPKGRPRVHTGGSVRGTTVVWGDYGLRMRDHHRRVSAAQLKIGEDAIKVRLKGLRYRLYKRVNADQAVYTKGNEVCTNPFV